MNVLTQDDVTYHNTRQHPMPTHSMHAYPRCVTDGIQKLGVVPVQGIRMQTQDVPQSSVLLSKSQSPSPMNSPMHEPANFLDVGWALAATTPAASTHGAAAALPAEPCSMPRATTPEKRVSVQLRATTPTERERTTYIAGFRWTW